MGVLVNNGEVIAVSAETLKTLLSGIPGRDFVLSTEDETASVAFVMKEDTVVLFLNVDRRKVSEAKHSIERAASSLARDVEWRLIEDPFNRRAFRIVMNRDEPALSEFVYRLFVECFDAANRRDFLIEWREA